MTYRRDDTGDRVQISGTYLTTDMRPFQGVPTVETMTDQWGVEVPIRGYYRDTTYVGTATVLDIAGLEATAEQVTVAAVAALPARGLPALTAPAAKRDGDDPRYIGRGADANRPRLRLADT